MTSIITNRLRAVLGMPWLAAGTEPTITAADCTPKSTRLGGGPRIQHDGRPMRLGAAVVT